MAMGTRKAKQAVLFVAADELPKRPTVQFYVVLNAILAKAGFDEFVENLCRPFYAAVMGRPSLAPGVYFRLHLLGYLLGLTSERRMALQAADSLATREFLGYELHESPPDHSTISRTRRRLSEAVHEQVFAWVLERLREAGLANGDAVAVDSTLLEASAALSTLERKDTKEDYREFVKRLAEEAGEPAGTVEELIEFDRKRAGKTLSNKEWEHPVDPDARVAKMKSGATDMGHKAEHAVDMESGALLGVTVQAADKGDTQTLEQTLEAVESAGGQRPQELTADKGYHSEAVVAGLTEGGVETYVSAPKRKASKRSKKAAAQAKRSAAKQAAQAAVAANRERVASARGKQLSVQRTEKAERSMAHMYVTGGLRRVYLRGRENIRKRLLIHACGYNLGVLMRALTGIGTPRTLQGQGQRLSGTEFWRENALKRAIRRLIDLFLGGRRRIRSNSHSSAFSRAC